MRPLASLPVTATAILCALSISACALAQVAASYPDAMVFIEDGTPLATETIGARWIEGDGIVVSGGTDDINQRILGRATIGPGDFHVHARLAIENLDNSAAAFTIGANSYFGFEGGHGSMFITGPLFDNARGTPIGDPADYIRDRVPFEFDVIREGERLTVLIDGQVAWEQQVTTEALGPVGFTPVRSTMQISQFSARGNLQPYTPPGASEITLDPRVEWVDGLPFGPFVRLADGGILGVARGSDARHALVSYDEGQTWQQREIFAPDDNMIIRPERALLRTRSGVIILIYTNDAVINYSWDRERNVPKPDMFLPTYCVRSLDDGRTWTEPQMIYDGWCGCIQDMIQTRNGNIVVPGQELLYDEGRHATMPYVSRDDGETWQRTRYLDIGGQGDHAGAIEGTLVELEDGRLWMLMRTQEGRFYQSFSPDQGLTWTDLEPSPIEATTAPGKLVRLQSGRLALVWNPPPTEGFGSRNEIAISFSEDDGENWTEPCVFASDPGGRLSYPHVFEHAPGELWITTMQSPLRVNLREEDFVGK